MIKFFLFFLAVALGVAIWSTFKNPCVHHCTRRIPYMYPMKVGSTTLMQTNYICVQGYYEQNPNVAERCGKL